MSARFIAYMPLSGPASVSAGQLADAIAARFPLIPMSVRPVGPAGGMGQSFLIAIDDVTLTVMLIDQPLPRDAYETALELDRVWPQAAEAMRGQKAHLIAATLDDAKSHGEAINAAAALTLAAAALVNLTGAKAVIWSNAETIIEPDRFMAAAAGLQDKRIPVDIWTGLRWLDGPPAAGGARTLAVLSSGLFPFIGREIEFEPAPMTPYEIGQRVIGLCDYLIRSGPVIGDGETVGLTEDEHIRVRHAEHGQRPGIPVLRLMIDSAGAGSAFSIPKSPTGPAADKARPVFGKRKLN
jgi:Domain of unknown function (DUF4261)